MTQNIGELSSTEANVLAQLAGQGQTIFTTAQVQKVLGAKSDATAMLGGLVRRGWLRRLERGLYLLVPLEAGPERAWTENGLVIAAKLVEPAAIAYWTALNYWNMTEQVPAVVFVQTTRRKRPVEVLGMHFRFVTVSEQYFFGIAQRSVDGKPIFVTDREKTLIDAAARPDLSGGVRQLAQALTAGLPDIDWPLLDSYLERWGGGVVVKRLGYLVEALDLSVPDRSNRLNWWQGLLTQGISPLEPGAGTGGSVSTRWRVRTNIDLGNWSRSI